MACRQYFSALDKIARFFNISIDELVHLDGDLPQEIEIEDKTTMEQLKLMQELDEEERSMIFKMIDSFLTKKKFKDFFGSSPKVGSKLKNNFLCALNYIDE